MSEILTKVIVDCATGIAETIPLTPEEISNLEAMRAKDELVAQQREAEELARAEAKAAAQSKLEALGLTPEEIAAITGA